ncbi:MAG: GNAT family N-acetyltransferase [Leptolyngbyaceae cyanobacterium]
MSISHASLRPTTAEDLEFVLQAESAAHAAGFVRLWTRDRHQQAFHEPDERHWIAVDDHHQIRVGYLILMGVEDPDRSLLIKRIVVTQTGRGYGRCVLEAALKIAFLELGAHRVWLDVMEDNERARSLYRQLGFVEEGCLRESVKRGDQFISMWLMSMLRAEFDVRFAPA